ncbi:HAD family hydrolase [Legionella lytica]|uniref:HAD family hydrolase n=1 Tax=Legionella lytica TaxID=96232 RepID=A0ABW8D368_9GAMM
MNYKSIFFILINALLFNGLIHAATLPSWNEGKIKQNIIAFVERVTNPSSPDYVTPDDRLAVFDNDGTLWLEQPLYTQFIFIMDRIQKLAAKHPEWKTKKPFNVILNGDKQALAQFSLHDIEQIIAVVHSGMSVDEFKNSVRNWLATTNNPRYERPYTQLVYQPMLEVLQYLREHDFKIYIVTGGGQDFVRTFSQQTYNVLPEKVIGSAGKTKFVYQNDKPELIKTPDILIFDDKKGKPEAINLFIGCKPIIAVGNSDGDKEMLEWTQSRHGASLLLLIHHDDDKREYSYGASSKIGTFSDALMNEAKKNHWNIVSMKNDWKIIFPFENKEKN